MAAALVLASTSPTRRALLTQAGFQVTTVAPRVDEEALRAAHLQSGTSHREIAAELAEAKAVKVARAHPGLVLGADQILTCEGRLFTKPADRADAAAQLDRLQGRTHTLFTAAVACRSGVPVWRHLAESRLTMRRLTAAQIEAYLTEAWPDVSDSVGSYRIEAQGLALFRAVDGEHTAILGLPMPQLIAWLDDCGAFA